MGRIGIDVGGTFTDAVIVSDDGRGRIGATGEEVEPLDEAGVRAAAARLREAGVEAVAVMLLFSFLNPAHEDRVGAILAEELPGVAVSLSSRVVPEYREYVRAST